MEIKTNANPFEINMYVQKSYEEGERHVKKIRGVASGPKKDRQGHMFSMEGIQSIQRAIEEGHIDAEGDWSEIPLVYEHENKWDSEIGWVTKAEIDDEGQLWIEAELDESSNKAMELYKRLTTPKRNGKLRQFGLSVKGKVTHYHKVWDEAMQSFAPVFNKMQLDEITVTSQPCYPADAYLAIAKSLNFENQEDTMSNVTGTTGASARTAANTAASKAEAAASGPMNHAQSEATSAPETGVKSEDVNENTNERPAEETAIEPGQVGVEVNPETIRESPKQDPSEIQSQTPDEENQTDQVEEPEVNEVNEDQKSEEETPAGYAVHPQNLEQEVVEVQKSLGDLVERFEKLEKAIDTLVREKGEEVVATTDEGDTVEVQKSDNSTSNLEAKFESIVVNAVGKLADELSIMKSLVEEISKDPADKSISIVKSKKDKEDIATPEGYREMLIQKGETPIKAGILTQIHFSDERG